MPLVAEYWYYETVALREGQQLMDTTGLTGWSGFSGGIGLRVNQFRVDYVFATRSDLGNLNMFSLLTQF